jgi:hypothetical protein
MKRTSILFFTIILLLLVGCGGGPKDVDNKLEKQGFRTTFGFGWNKGLDYNTKGECVDYFNNPKTCFMLGSKSELHPSISLKSDDFYPSIVYFINDDTDNNVTFYTENGYFVSTGDELYVIVDVGKVNCAYFIEGTKKDVINYTPCTDSGVESAKAIMQEYKDFLKKNSVSEKQLVEFFDWQQKTNLNPIVEKMKFTDEILAAAGIEFVYFANQASNSYNNDGKCVGSGGNEVVCNPVTTPLDRIGIFSTNIDFENGSTMFGYVTFDTYYLLEVAGFIDYANNGTYYFYSYDLLSDGQQEKYVYLNDGSCSYDVFDNKVDSKKTSCSEDKSNIAQAIVDNYIEYTSKLGITDTDWTAYFEYLRGDYIKPIINNINNSLK